MRIRLGVVESRGAAAAGHTRAYGAPAMGIVIVIERQTPVQQRLITLYGPHFALYRLLDRLLLPPAWVMLGGVDWG